MTGAASNPPTPDLARLVRLHAEASLASGVDFLPAYARPAGSPLAPAPRGEPTPVPRPAMVANPAAPPGPAAVPSPAPAVSRAPRPAEPPPRMPEAPAAAPEPANEVPARAGVRDRAGVVRAMNDLRERYEREAPHRYFVTAHTRIVWGDGDPCARLVFVGEAPGEDEDRQGVPFVGRSGQLLTKMITAMGLSRDEVYICNVLKTRPPNNATPTGREIELCEPFLRAQLSIISPEVIVTLGLPAARALLRSDESMTRMRGKWRTYALEDGRQVRLMPTFHPAYVLRNYTPETRGQVWGDLRLVMGELGLAPGQADLPQ
ncbi:MAG: uracil-DNA glycosylase [Planctomycetota bacterium]|nr:uracil-DNA glycosylase [Planctomycetota bacterium]